MIKKYHELKFTDDFLFCKILSSDKALCKELLELVLGFKIRDIDYSDRQKDFKFSYEGKGIRLDVYAEDEEGVYDIEMQTTLPEDLPRRSRYYQGMVDINQLEKGAHYSELKKSFIIFICLKDFSDRDLPVYTFTNRCAQDLTLEIQDGATRVIINASGKRDGLSKDMSAFLDFLKDGKDSNAFTSHLKKDVEDAMMNREWGIEYMSMNARLMDERAAGKKEGIAEGEAERQKLLAKIEDLERIIDSMENATVDK